MMTSNTTGSSSITLEKLQEAMDKLPKQENTMLSSPLNFSLGKPVFQIEPDIRPTIQLSEDVMVSDEFRHRCNAWYLEIFGTRDYSVIEKGRAFFMPQGIFVRKDDLGMLNLLSMGV